MYNYSHKRYLHDGSKDGPNTDGHIQLRQVHIRHGAKKNHNKDSETFLS